MEKYSFKKIYETSVKTAVFEPQCTPLPLLTPQFCIREALFTCGQKKWSFIFPQLPGQGYTSSQEEQAPDVSFLLQAGMAKSIGSLILYPALHSQGRSSFPGTEGQKYWGPKHPTLGHSQGGGSTPGGGKLSSGAANTSLLPPQCILIEQGCHSTESGSSHPKQ